MKVICKNGFYKFYPEAAYEIVQFQNTFGRSLVRRGDYYTFSKLADLPDYSIMGQMYGGLVAIANYAGPVEDVFGENKLKYNVIDDKIELNGLIDVVHERADNFAWVVTGIPAAYAQLSDRTIISGYQGFVNVNYGYTTVIGWENADF